MNRLVCQDCRHFQPHGRVERHGPVDPYLEGECRSHCPALGPMINDRDGDRVRHFGEWPRVLACDWCGEYEPLDDETPSDTQADESAITEPLPQ